MNHIPFNEAYPYLTIGVRYETPPSAVNFPNNGAPKVYSGGSEDYIEYMDLDEDQYLQEYLDDHLDEHLADDEDEDEDENEDEDASGPGLGDGLAGLGGTTNPTEDPGVGTFGVELEFLAVQCPRVKLSEDEELYILDPHPRDNRWISETLCKWEMDAWQFKQSMGEDLYEFTRPGGSLYDSDDQDIVDKRSQYSRNKLTRILRKKGLTVIKWPEKDINPEEEDTVLINDFNESEPSDDELEDNFPNSQFLDNFTSFYNYDDSLSTDENVSGAVLKWQGDFEQYHETYNLKMQRTKVAEIDKVVRGCFVDGWPDLEPRQIHGMRAILEDRLKNLRLIAKQAREDARNIQVDPLHVPVPGLKAQYKAWTVTNDLSVDGNGMVAHRYDNPEGIRDPIGEYCWFGAEVVSPVLPMGDERARQAIRDACGCLRDQLRVHKPMHVSTGLHIHLGNTKGWSLFQAKRFATLWFLAEKTILGLHRIDRDEDMRWCAKIEGGSRLWRALYSNRQDDRNSNAFVLMNQSPPNVTRVFNKQLVNNVPGTNPNLTDKQKTVLYYIWHLESITKLHTALGESASMRTGVKWRIRGNTSSLEGYKDPMMLPQPGTIEVRIMQGTLDADHINNWVAVLECITLAVRNLPDDQFQGLIDQFLRNQTQDGLLGLLGVPDDIRRYWLAPKRRDRLNRYWEYPDHDLVDWTQPFMVPGHKATHGAFWD